MDDQHSWFEITIAKPFQGQGFGREALSWLLQWAFTSGGLRRIEGESKSFANLPHTREDSTHDFRRQRLFLEPASSTVVLQTVRFCRSSTHSLCGNFCTDAQSGGPL